jgi:hypothetical protein
MVNEARNPAEFDRVTMMARSRRRECGGRLTIWPRRPRKGAAGPDARIPRYFLVVAVFGALPTLYR